MYKNMGKLLFSYQKTVKENPNFKGTDKASSIHFHSNHFLISTDLHIPTF